MTKGRKIIWKRRDDLSTIGRMLQKERKMDNEPEKIDLMMVCNFTKPGMCNRSSKSRKSVGNHCEIGRGSSQSIVGITVIVSFLRLDLNIINSEEEILTEFTSDEIDLRRYCIFIEFEFDFFI